ncbi:MAG: SMP-30/gluconolactonase/LRE family protein, partial [Steroidobacteraceae bacterium]
AKPSRITALALAAGALGCGAAWAPHVDAAPAARGAQDVVIGRNIYPESLSAAPDGTLYIGSVMGAVYRVVPGSTRAEPWIRADAANGLGSVFGVLVDARADTLWVCSTPSPLAAHAGGSATALVAFDLATRRRVGFYPFPPPKATCNDITVGPDGTAYATDTPNGRILELPRGAHALEVFAHDARLKGVDGIAFSGDGVLYADLVTSNRLIRIDRKPDGRFAGVTPLASSRTLGAPDGLRLIAGNRFMLAEGGSGRIDEVSIDGKRAAITVLRSGFMSPPGVTFVRGGTAYAVDGKIGYLIDPHLKGKDPGPFEAYAIALPASHPAGRHP